MRKGFGKSFLTLVSVLSVILAFSVVTVLCLFAIDRLGLFSLENTLLQREETTGDSGLSGEEFSLPLHTQIEHTVSEIPSGVTYFDKLLQMAPFVDNYYIKLQVVSSPMGDTSIPQSGIYEIWHFGERFKIHWYGNNGVVRKIITCDGIRVQVTDFVTAETYIHDVEQGYSYEEMTPVPSFDTFLTENREVFDFSERDGICMAACEFFGLSTLDTVRFYMETGILRSFSRYRNGATVLTIDTVSMDLDFRFADYMFAIE